jgi:hypothetical protein
MPRARCAAQNDSWATCGGSSAKRNDFASSAVDPTHFLVFRLPRLSRSTPWYKEEPHPARGRKPA